MRICRSARWHRPTVIPGRTRGRAQPRRSTSSPTRCTPTARCPPPRSSRAPRRRASSCSRLSDHDTVDGVDEAHRGRAPSTASGIVPAVEISSVQDEYEDLHVLGYGIDHTDPHLLARARALPRRPRPRADRMAEALQEHGFELDTTVARRARAAGKPIGRPHLAQAAFEPPRQRASGSPTRASTDFSRAARRLPHPRRAGLPRAARSRRSSEAIELIHARGRRRHLGAPVLGHRGRPGGARRRSSASAAAGLDGVEVFYVDPHARADAAARRLLHRARPAHDRVERTSTAPSTRIFSRFLAHELHGREPNLGPIAGDAQRPSAARDAVGELLERELLADVDVEPPAGLLDERPAPRAAPPTSGPRRRRAARRAGRRCGRGPRRRRRRTRRRAATGR